MHSGTKEISHLLGVSISTVKSWADQFDIPSERHGHKRVFDTEALKVFKTIQNLKDKNSGFVTIQKVLSDSNQLNRSPDDRQAGQEIEILIEKAVSRQNEIAEKYARATFEIGQLQERVRVLETAKEKLEGSLQLLPDSTEWRLAQESQAQQAYKIAELTANLESMKAENMELKRKNKSWWAKLWGKNHA